MQTQQAEQQLDHTPVKMDELSGRIGECEIGADTERVDTIRDLFREIAFHQTVQSATCGDAAQQQIPAGEGLPDAFAQKPLWFRARKAGADDDCIKDTKKDRDRKGVDSRQRKRNIQKDDHEAEASRGVDHGEERGNKKLLKYYRKQQ